MPDIGPLELVIILVIVLLVFGPKRLPGLGRQLGTGMREFKDSITGKDKDDRHDDDDAKKPAPALERAPQEAEVVTAEAQREERPASRAES
jgi:sec-independent protein translocase protein TatA